MARHEAASAKPDDTSVANIENPTQAQDQDEFGGGSAGSSGGLPTGMDYRSVEVTDLVIPSGTDWSTAHSLGANPLEAGEVAFVTFRLELAEPLDIADSGFTLQADMEFLAAASGAQFTPGGNVSDTVAVDAGYGFMSDAIAAFPPVVYLQTAAPTSEEITVVSARATFLVI